MLSALEEQSFHAIGQARKDTALYDLPIRTGKRGRPAKYGKKYTADAIAGLPEKQEELFVYGRKQMVRYRSVKCLARFMKGRMVRAVWTQFEDKSGNLAKVRVLLSTNPDLSAKQIIEYYARRWSIEDLFNQMKNKWGWKETWQQSRQILHRWVQILSVIYALPRLLATYLPNHWQQAKTLTPWRKKQPITAGRVRLILKMILGNVRVRDWWNPKCRKFEPPIYSDFKDKTRQSYKQQPDKGFKSYQNDGSPPPI